MSLVDSSTLRLLREEGLKGILLLRTPHAYVYLRWIKPYVKFAIKVLIPRMSQAERDVLASFYHSKVLTQTEAEAIVTIRDTIDLHEVPDQMIPFEHVRDIVIKQPHAIAVIDCACRSAQDGCHPRQVCMIIGQPFVDFVMQHQPNAKRLTEAEAIQLLRDERDRGHVHNAWFKDACMGRFYAICNCCKCCCSGVKAMKDFGTRIVAPSGYVAELDVGKCNGCGACADVCLYDGIKVVDGRAVHSFDKCMGCGLCVSRCDVDALKLRRDNAKGIPFDVRLIAADRALIAGKEPEKDAWDKIRQKLGMN